MVMKKSRNKTSDFEPIGRVLEKTIRGFRKPSDMDLTRIWECWDEVAGEVVAENAQPAAFKGHILVVHVTSSTWIHQLRFVQDELTSKLNQALGKELVREIKFKTGAVG